MKPCSRVQSPVWDAFWLQSALWLAPLALILAHGYDDPADGPLDLLVFLLTAVFWIGHRLASAWLAYATTAYRPLLRADPVRFAIVPLAIAAACFAILLPGDDALPFTRSERVMALASVDFVFVTYHFAAQHFGVLSLFRIRSGRAADALARRLDLLFAMGAGGALVVVIEAVAQTTAFQEFGAAQWFDQEWVGGATEILRAAATALVVALTLALLAVEARAPSVSIPRVLYALGLAAMVCGGLHMERPFLFVAVWSAQHWLVATALATRVASAEPPPTDSRAWRILHAINRRPWVLLFVLGSISILLLPVMEVEAVKNEGTFYGERIFGALAAALRTSDLVPALIAFGFATGFLHYWLDRAVYRLSHPAVRSAARGLFPDSTAPAATYLLTRREV